MRINPKRAGGQNPPPLDIFCYISAGCYFFALKLHDFFPSSLALNLRPFFKNRTGGYDAALRNTSAGFNEKLTKNWFSMEITHKSCFFVFFCFRIHFHYVLSYLFGLFEVRTCVSILWHTSLPKNATFAWKNSEKTMILAIFGDFRVFWHDVTYDVTVASYKVCLYFI